MDKTYEELLADVQSGKTRILVVGSAPLGCSLEAFHRVVESLEFVQLADLETLVVLDDSRRVQSLELPVLDDVFLRRLLASHQPSSEDAAAEEAEKRRNYWWKQPGARKKRHLR